MLAETGSSMLDGALTCIGERISAILLQPGIKKKNYIASLHNEVVSLIWCPKKSYQLNLDLACRCVDHRPSVIWRQLSLCARVCQGRLPTVFRTSGSQVAILKPMEASCCKARSSHQTLPNLISRNGGKWEKGSQGENHLMSVMS